MIEQSNVDAPVYGDRIVTDPKQKLVSKSVKPKDVTFGPAHQIAIHFNSQTSDVLVVYVDEPQPNAYRYTTTGDHHLINQLSNTKTTNDRIETYYYGIAKRDGQLEPYFMKNRVPVTADYQLSRDHFELPATLCGYQYEQTFHYLPQLASLLGPLPTTYTDRFKRPLNANAIGYHKYYPTSIDKVTTTFDQLWQRPTHLPLVVKLNPDQEHATLACLDLEPTATPEQAKLIEQYEAYYVEDTPRGGKHYLVKAETNDTAFKYRLNPNLEVQVHCQITFYGLNGQWLNDDPKPSHFEAAKATGHQQIMPTTIKEPIELTAQIDDLIQTNQMLGLDQSQRIAREYQLDPDVSHADWNALYHLYLQNVRPFAKSYAADMLPWILGYYTKRIIPSRPKHDDQRQGLPYLVWVAAKVITKIEAQRGKLYE